MKKRSSAEIDKEMEAERQTIRAMQAKLDRAKKDRAKAEAAQTENAYDAIGREDAKAQERLDAAEDALTKADRRISSIEMAIAKATEKFNGLVAEWKRALDCEALEKLQALARRKIEKLAPRADRVFKELAEVFAEDSQINREMFVIRESLNPGYTGGWAKLKEDNLPEFFRSRVFLILGEQKNPIGKALHMYQDRNSIVELEADSYKQLLALKDLPDAGGSGNGQDHSDDETGAAVEGDEIAAAV